MKKLPIEGMPYQLEGMFVPFNPELNKPILLKMDGKLFLPVFSTKEKLEEAAKWVDIGFASHNVIVDYQDFKRAVFAIKKEFTVHVIVDPYKTETGSVRFNLIPLDDEEKKLIGE